MYIRMFIVAVLGMMVLQGCGTVKGAGKGLGEDMYAVGKASKKTADGTGSLIVGTKNLLDNTDQWMRDNMW